MDLDSGCGSTRHRKARIFKKKEKRKEMKKLMFRKLDVSLEG
jgi:hypothetical protein